MPNNTTGSENSFCGDDFWDTNLTWNTPIPDFTQCFQQIVFVVTPCLTFWLIAIVSLCITCKQSSNFQIPWSLLNVSKLIICGALICLSIVELVFASVPKITGLIIPDIVLCSASIKISAYVLIFIIILKDRASGKKSSTLLTLFWFFMTLCSIVIFRSSILRIVYKQLSPITPYKYIPDSINSLLLCCAFLLSLFSDKTVGDPLEKKSPFEEAPFFSFLTFHWFNSIIYEGRKKLLTLDDLPPLPIKLQASYLWEKFQDKWSKELQKQCVADTSDDNGKKYSPRLSWTLIKTFWPWFLVTCILQLIDCTTCFIPPLLLHGFLKFFTGNEYLWKGYLYCVALFLCDLLSRIAGDFMLYYSLCFGLQLQTTLSSAIYRKSLKLSNSAKRNFTSGEIANFLSVDVEKVYNFSTYFSFILGGPIKILLTVVFLWLYLGPSCLSGIALLVIMIVFTGFASSKINYLQEKQMETKDSRLKFMTEILNGIKVLKLYAWELPFMKKITDIRLTEVKFLRSFQMCFAVFSFVWGSASFLVAVASFVTYVLVDKNHVLDPTTVFVSLNLLSILRYAVLEVPEVAADVIQTMVSIKRLTNFLASEERDEKQIGDSPDSGEVLSIRNSTFSWNPKEEPTLKDIDLHVPKGYLVAVIGPVGSGKTSLLSAVLGEMYKISGSADLKGDVAYVPQQAWILNQTVAENILFIKPMSRKKYDTILDSCCLKPDLDILPAGDKTEIGEKGVNLSGGQKQRISLARSVYHDADMYLLDDPLSAVDAHVGKHIFEHVIGKNGLLKNKTRILVTHNISVLPEADFIITMKDGKIQEKGTYNELMDRQELFFTLIKEYSNVKDDDEDIEHKDISEPHESLAFHQLVLRSISVQSKEGAVSIDSKTFEVDGQLTEEEWMEVGEVKRETFIRYAKHMSFKILFIISMGYLGHQILEIGGNVWLSKWSSDPPPVNGTQDIPLRNMRIGVYTALGLLQGFAIVLGSVSLAFGAARAARRFHAEMLESIMKAPMTFFDTTPLGRIINRFGRDMDDIDSQIPMQIDGWLACMFGVIGTFCIIGSSTPLFLPFLIPVMGIYYVIQKLYLITSRQLKRLSSTTRSPVYSHLTESIQGASSINAYKVSESFIRKAEYKMNANCSCQFMWNSCARWLNFYLSIIGDLIILLTAIMAVLSKDHLEAAVIGLSVTYALSVTDLLIWLVRTGTELENRAVAVERVTEYSNLSSEAPWKISDAYPPPSWPAVGSIEFKSYSTRYRENLDLVLNDVNLKIGECEKVGIVGRTGAGKSSFALALFRIIEPVTGTINIDDVDVTQIGLHQLRSKLTIIPQDPVLFTGPLRINLDPNEDHSDDDIWWSLEHANLKTFVSSLPEGLEHDVAEGGSNLSVGQRQLVCLARALLKKTKILVLDEATAAVDVETDHLIQNTIRNEFKDRTVITIAHRLNTILDYDKVLVMDSGTIREVGKPTDLLQKTDTHFYRMAKDAGLVT